VTLQDLLRRLVPKLERVEVPYMVTGSVASSAHGMPRSTRDLDLVIAPTREQLVALMREFSTSDYYADDQQALQALAQRSQFNIIDYATGWKVDFIIAEASEYGRAALARRKIVNIDGNAVYTASAEDVLLAKLRWAKMSGSERQLQDARGIVATQANNLDADYVESWVRKLGLYEQWDLVRTRE
jgi:hypothetical protein